MEIPISGKTYLITNCGSGYNLNQFAGQTANGTNVTQWAPSSSDTEQHWKYSKNRLYPSNSNAVCLDRYITQGSYYNNADLWEDNDAEQQELTLVAQSDGSYLIALKNARYNGNVLYLTASATRTGASASGKAPGANGNVYWATITGSASQYQKWTFTQIASSSSSQKLFTPYVNTVISASYKHPTYTIKEGTVHYGVDFFGDGQVNLYASGDGIVVGKNPNMQYLGNVLAVQYNNVVKHNNTILPAVVFRYCHLASYNVSVGDHVNSNTCLAVTGMTGQHVTGVHVHIEADTDTQYPLGTPSEPSTGGNDLTMFNPIEVLYLDSNQSYNTYYQDGYIFESDKTLPRA